MGKKSFKNIVSCKKSMFGLYWPLTLIITVLSILIIFNSFQDARLSSMNSPNTHSLMLEHEIAIEQQQLNLLLSHHIGKYIFENAQLYVYEILEIGNYDENIKIELSRVVREEYGNSYDSMNNELTFSLTKGSVASDKVVYPKLDKYSYEFKEQIKELKIIKSLIEEKRKDSTNCEKSTADMKKCIEDTIFANDEHKKYITPSNELYCDRVSSQLKCFFRTVPFTSVFFDVLVDESSQDNQELGRSQLDIIKKVTTRNDEQYQLNPDYPMFNDENGHLIFFIPRNNEDFEDRINVYEENFKTWLEENTYLRHHLGFYIITNNNGINQYDLAKYDLDEDNVIDFYVKEIYSSYFTIRDSGHSLDDLGELVSDKYDNDIEDMEIFFTNGDSNSDSSWFEQGEYITLPN